jgi:hypothetical protein
MILPMPIVRTEVSMSRLLVTTLAGALLLASSFAGAESQTAIAQAGSTGGTIGKQNKSVSGADEPTTANRSKPAAKPRQPVSARTPAPSSRKTESPCGKVAGTWSWWVNGDVVVQPNGTAAQAASGLTGTWSCRDGEVAFIWSHGFTDRMRLSPDGTRLSGSNNLGFGVSGVRK